MKILRTKSFSRKEKKEERDKKRSAAKIGTTTLLGASIGGLASSSKAGKNFDKEYDDVISKYEEGLERRAQEIKAMGANPAKVEVAKHMKFVSDSNKLYDLANKRGNKAYIKTSLKGAGIGAATGFGLGVANHVIAKNKKKKKHENTKN